MDAATMRRLLQDNMHHVVRTVRVDRFFPYLRQQNAITQDDQEEVINKNATNTMRSSDLLDIIMSKGDDGVKAYMYALEAVYPELFREITKQEPRNEKQLKNFYLPITCEKSDSENCFRQFCEALSSLLAEKKSREENLDKLLHQMESAQNKELEIRNSEIRLANEKLENEKDNNARISEKIAELKSDLQTANQKIEELIKKNEQLTVDCLSLKHKNDELRILSNKVNRDGEKEMQRSQTYKPATDRMKKLEQDNTHIEHRLTELLQKYPSKSSIDWPKEELNTLKNHIAEYKTQLEKSSVENKTLREKVDEQEKLCQLMQQTNNRQLLDIENLNNDKQKYYEEIQKLRLIIAEEKEKRELREQECQKFEACFLSMDENNQKLQRQLAVKDKSRKPPGNLLRRDISFDNPFRRPVVLFSPEEIHQNLVSQLLHKFETCELEDTPLTPAEIAKRIISNDVIYNDNTSGQMKYLTTERIKLCLSEAKRPVLLALPVECIKRMTLANISTVNVVVKIQGQQSEEEKKLKHTMYQKTHRDAISYETVEISPETLTDIERVSEIVVASVKQLYGPDKQLQLNSRF